MKITTFEEKNEIGKKGELLAMYLYANSNFLVADLTSNKEARKKDIDFLALSKIDNSLTAVEVKTDQIWNKSDNFCFEYISNNKKWTQGWTLYTEADFVMMYYPNAVPFPRFYILKAQHLKNWYKDNYKKKQFKKIETQTKNYYKSLCTLVNKKLLIDMNICIQVIEFNTQTQFWQDASYHYNLPPAA